METDEQSAARKGTGRGTHEPRTYGMAFWIVSAVWGTGLLFTGATVTLTTIFLSSIIHSDGLSVDAIGTAVGAAFFWSFIVLVATCYISVPVAALLTGGVRMIYRRVAKMRRAPEQP